MSELVIIIPDHAFRETVSIRAVPAIENGRYVELFFKSPSMVHIGRMPKEPDCANVLLAPQLRRVSRHHVLLVPDGSGWTVQDLESANGTYCNGQWVPPGRPQPLPEDCALLLGGIGGIKINVLVL